MNEDLYDSDDLASGKTIVFWNLEDYPIPSTDYPSIYRNVKSALRKKSIRGTVEFQVYASNLDYDESALFKAGINYIGPDMCLDILLCVAPIYLDKHKSRIFMVFAKRKLEDEQNQQVIELHRVLQCLKSRKFNVLLVELPDDTTENIFVSPDSVLGRIQDFNEEDEEKKPIRTI